MLPKLTYLALYSTIQLLALLARGDAARTWRSWSCATSSPSSDASSHDPSSSPPDRALLAAVSRLLPRDRWSCCFVTPTPCGAGTAGA